MKECIVYKVGNDYYENNPDKNSGSYEVKIIKKALLNDFSIVEDAPIAFIISGRMSDKDIYYISNMNAKTKKVLIATDIDCIQKLTSTFDFDIILHQFTSSEYQSSKMKYSYIPELFITHFQYIPDCVKKIDKILFAGTLNGREEKIEMLKSENSFIIPKNNEFDRRLPYDEYIILASLFKFHYIAVTNKAIKDGWVTSRFVEAVKFDATPIVDYEYDMFNHFNIPSFLRVKNAEDINKIYNDLRNLEIKYKFKEKISKNSSNFKQIAWEASK